MSMNLQVDDMVVGKKTGEIHDSVIILHVLN